MVANAFYMDVKLVTMAGRNGGKHSREHVLQGKVSILAQTVILTKSPADVKAKPKLTVSKKYS